MPLHPKCIALGTDFEAGAAVAEADAARLANLFRAEIAVLHAEPLGAPDAAQAAQASRAELARVAARLAAAGVAVRVTQILHGSAAEALLQAAEALGAELIVVGASNRAGDLLTGATAETVARFAKLAVYIARPRLQPELRHIVCGVDGSPSAAKALADAQALAALTGADLIALHAVELFEPATVGAEARARTAQMKTSRVERVDRLVKEVGGPDAIRLVHVEGRVHEVLRAHIRSERCDVLVLGRVGTSGLRRVLLGGVAERLLRSVPCALLLTSPADAQL